MGIKRVFCPEGVDGATDIEFKHLHELRAIIEKVNLFVGGQLGSKQDNVQSCSTNLEILNN